MSGETLSLSNSSFFLFIIFILGGGGEGVRKKIGELTLFPAFSAWEFFSFAIISLKK